MYNYSCMYVFNFYLKLCIWLNIYGYTVEKFIKFNIYYIRSIQIFILISALT